MSFRLVWLGRNPVPSSEPSSTTKPWFWLVISIRPEAWSRTGWLAPRWPNLSFHVSAPAASANSWWPRQMPKIGTLSSRPRMVSMAYVTAAGSPGPLLRNTPSGSSARISSADVVAGTTCGSRPNVTSERRMFRLIPKSIATTR